MIKSSSYGLHKAILQPLFAPHSCFVKMLCCLSTSERGHWGSEEWSDWLAGKRGSWGFAAAWSSGDLWYRERGQRCMEQWWLKEGHSVAKCSGACWCSEESKRIQKSRGDGTGFLGSEGCSWEWVRIPEAKKRIPCAWTQVNGGGRG